MTWHVYPERLPVHSVHLVARAFCGHLFDANLRGSQFHEASPWGLKDVFGYIGGRSWKGWCTECLDHPEVQLRMLAEVEL